LAIQELGGELAMWQVEPGVHYWPRFTRDGSQVLFIFDNPRNPPDLWMMTLGGRFARLTSSFPEHILKTEFLMPEDVTYPGLDGVPVPSLLFKPQVKEPGAAVILIHGGPDWHFEMTWYPVMANMASRGWVVLVPNYRGSTGYGRAWQNASRFDYGGTDADDVTAGAHFLIMEGLADPRRIGITGRSHGGYLTACCLTRAPDLWAAGSAFVPFLNWFTNHAEIRPDLQHWDIENFGDPLENYDRWHDHSPSFFLDRIQAPLQLICGRQDARCPVTDSIEAHATLQRLGKQSELIFYEDEGHIFLKIGNIIDSETRRIEFLAKYLDGMRVG
jgi:dipeptidyl aminopeptidase/acylaminoacyl peptidase